MGHFSGTPSCLDGEYILNVLSPRRIDFDPSINYRYTKIHPILFLDFPWNKPSSYWGFPTQKWKAPKSMWFFDMFHEININKPSINWDSSPSGNPQKNTPNLPWSLAQVSRWTVSVRKLHAWWTNAKGIRQPTKCAIFHGDFDGIFHQN